MNMSYAEQLQASYVSDLLQVEIAFGCETVGWKQKFATAHVHRQVESSGMPCMYKDPVHLSHH